MTFTPKGGAAINVTLQAGQTYKYAGGSNDLTGSTISASQNVAVFSGHECGQVPVGATFCDTLLEQAIPTSKLSTTYYTTATVSRIGDEPVRPGPGDLDGRRYRGVEDGVAVATLAAGSFYEFLLPTGSGTKIEASHPVAVAQYLTGGGGANTDPAFTYVPGADALLNSYLLSDAERQFRLRAELRFGGGRCGGTDDADAEWRARHTSGFTQIGTSASTAAPSTCRSVCSR